MRRILFTVFISLFGIFLFSQSGPFNTPAEVSLEFSTNPQMGSDITVDVYCDLNGVTNGSGINAMLGGYAVSISFDSSKLKLKSVTAGSTSPFSSSDFVYTDIDRANRRGFVTVLNTQTTSSGPGGIVHLATLTFTPVEGGKVIFNGKSSRTLIEPSLSSIYESSGGPSEIEYTPENTYDVLNIDPNGNLLHLYVPYFYSVSSGFEGVSIVNYGGSDSSVKFYGYDESGNLVDVQGGVNGDATEVSVGSGSQYVRMVQNLFGVNDPIGVDGGWIDIISSSNDVSGFFLIGENDPSTVYKTLDGVDLSFKLYKELYIPIMYSNSNAKPNRVLIFNPSSNEVSGRLSFRDSEGNEVYGEDVDISPHGEYIHTVDMGQGDISYGVFTTNNDAEVGGIEIFGESGDSMGMLSCLGESDASNVLYATHLASGYVGNVRYYTRFNIVNPGDSDVTVTFSLIDDSGNLIGSSVSKSIKAHGELDIKGYELFNLEDPTTTDKLTIGTVKMVSSGNILGCLTFGDAANSKFMATLPLLSTSSIKNELYLDHVAIGNIGGIDYFTGITIYNPGSETAHMTITLYDQDGNEITKTNTPYELGPGKRLSTMLQNIFSNLPGDYSQAGGFLKIESDKEVCSFMLFGDAGLNFLSAIPVR